MNQGEEVVDQYEQYETIVTSGNEVYAYEHPIIAISGQPISSTGIQLKRGILEKDQNEQLIDPSNPNVAVTEGQPVYVELKNEGIENLRYPGSVRYEPSERHYRPPYNLPPPSHHQQIHHREEVMKDNEQLQHHQQQHQSEIRIAYEVSIFYWP